MIPVLGIPVINRPDLLAACLASIDEPVERLIVIDNSGTGTLGDLAAEIRPDAIIVDPPSNLGVAGSWNFVIQTTPAAPWWCLVNADVEFAPGDLARLEMRPEPEVRCLIEFGAFGITAACIDAVGTFDASFFPIYCEDTDYRYRCRLAGVPIIDVPNSSHHVGSVSYIGNPLARNTETYPRNVSRYVRKWGGWIGQERFTTPFDAGGSVADWTWDRAAVAAQQWSTE